MVRCRSRCFFLRIQRYEHRQRPKQVSKKVPHDLERTCAIPPPSQIPDKRYVALVQHNNTARYATIHHTPLGTHYEELYLDKHRRPHLTGQQLTPSPYEDVLQVELWDDTPTIPKPDYGSSILNEIWRHA